jgi:hypothetical protein
MAGDPIMSSAAGRQASAMHEGFLRHAGFRWLKRSLALCAAAIAAYALVDVEPRHNGGSWLGYALGTLGAGLILWLTALGLRKRWMTPGVWSLKAWTSAHVYLGLALIVIATLHTGFQLGWNVHTLAYALMMLVILSGAFGTAVYASLPAALSRNREEMTATQMLETLAVTDRQLQAAAQPLERRQADHVLAALGESAAGGGLWSRLTGTWRNSATQAALAALSPAAKEKDALPALARIDDLLQRRSAQLARIRRHLRLKALLEVWLYVHVPASIALLAALSAHIISVFFYW